MTKASKNVEKKSSPPAKKTKASSRSTSSPSRGGTGGPQKILDFCLFLETRSGNPDVPRKQVLAASGVKSNTFPVTISGMKKKGLIDYDKDSIRLSDAGRAKANLVNVAADNTTAQNDLKARFKIGGKALVLFDILSDGRVHDRASVVDSLGLKSKGSAAVLLSNLKKNGLIEYDKTTIIMSDIAFPFGRPESSD